MVALQLALDFTSLDDALAIAEAAAHHVDILEVGTPLIKAEGLSAVSRLKDLYPDHQVVADMKTMDTGFMEAELAFRAGADIATVLGAAARETIEAALDAADKCGRKVMVDSIGVADGPGLVKKIDGLGVHWLVIHTGIDQQGAGHSPFADLDTVHGLDFDAGLALVGGLNAKSMAALADYPRVDLVMVGGAVTRTDDPGRSAQEIREAVAAIPRKAS